MDGITERGAFEGWCLSKNSAYKPQDDGVSNRRDWEVWQAAIAQPVQPVPDGYGKTDFGFTFAGVAPSEGAKRLMAMLVEDFGTAHPAIDDLTALIFDAAILASKSSGGGTET